jgi:hypothetical protein
MTLLSRNTHLSSEGKVWINKTTSNTMKQRSNVITSKDSILTKKESVITQWGTAGISIEDST